MSNFHHSAQDTRVDDGHILRARLQNGNGDFVDAEINLNDCLGNDNGRFDWGGRGFADSAESIRFEFEGDQPILRARLFNVEGQAIDADVNLCERLSNNDGNFHFECTSYIHCTHSPSQEYTSNNAFYRNDSKTKT